MADNSVLDPDQQFADGVAAQRQDAQDATTAVKYAPIGPSFSLDAGSSKAMPSDANATANTDPAVARYADAPTKYRFEPLAAPISLADLKPQAPAGAPDGSVAGDVGKTLLGGLETGIGQVVRGVGKGAQMIEAGAADAPELGLTDSEKTSMGKSNPLDSTADQLENRGASTLASRSPVSIMAEENSRLGGSLTDPSTWTFGKDPSLRGYLMQGADALGTMAPVLLASYMSGPLAPVTGALVGGAQAGGQAIDQARATIAGMDDAELAKQSKVYRKALADGASKKEARQQATEAAENWAAAVTAPIGAVGGALTGKIFSPTGRVFGASGILGQSGGKAALSGTEQAVQNVGQGIATEAGINQGAGTDRDVTAGSFGNAVTGFVAGALPGAVHGAVEGVRTSKIPVAADLQPTDITFHGKPFIALPAARAAAAKAGDGAQVMRLGNRFIVRRPVTPGEELTGSLGEQGGTTAEQPGTPGGETPAGADTAIPANVNVPTAKRQANGQSQARANAGGTGEFSPGDRIFVTQNGRSTPVEFVGYENNVATQNSAQRLARVRLADGSTRFVTAGDLTGEAAPTPALGYTPAAGQPGEAGQSMPGQLPGPAPVPALEGPGARAALPAPDNVSGAGEGFVTRPTQNIPADAPRGIRNNNPGNIGKGAGFQGETDGNDPRFATFSTPEQGIRALAVNLLAYQDLHGLNTVNGIINRWAPSSENNTAAYVKDVAKEVGVDPTAEIDLHDPKVLAKVTAAIIQHENAMQPYAGEMIDAAVDSAISGRQMPKGLPAPTIAVDSAGQAKTADQRTQSAQEQAASRARLDELGLTGDVAAAGAKHPANIDDAAHQAQTSPLNGLDEPTDAQKEAGNYKLGHARIGGLDISIENPEGSTRSGVDTDGRPWSSTMRSHYGYIRGTLARDGDHIDAFVKPGTPPDYEGPVYVVDQTDPSTGAFDEHKVMIGYGSQRQAEAAYRENYTKGWKGMGAITPMEMPAFKAWLDGGKTQEPVAELPNQPAQKMDQAAEPEPQETGLGSIATDSTKANGKGYLTRSEAQKAAKAQGGNVVKQGDRFVVRDEIPGQDVAAPGSGGKNTEPAQVTTPAGRDIGVQYRVVDADNLVASHTDTGQTNPDYPAALQPRDRSRAASEMQINDIGQNLRPQLLGASATTTDGAPIISHRGIVESGNGRTLAIKRAYDQDLPSAKRYRAWLKAQGYDVTGIKKPVLVRQRTTPLSDADMRAYTRESNARSTLQMSSTEQARADAKSIGPILADYQGGDIQSAANRDFVRKFVRDVAGANERGGMVGPDGTLTQDGARRIQAAVLSAAYDSPELVSDLFESTDSNIRTIGTAMLDAAGHWAQLREAIKQGAVPKDMDITPNLVDALNIVRKARAEGHSVHDVANQNDMLSGAPAPETLDFLHTFFKDDQFSKGRSRNTIADMLSEYTRIAESTEPGENLFGEQPPTGGEVLRKLNERHSQTDNGQQHGLFESQAGDAAGNEKLGPEEQRQGSGSVRGRSAQGGQRSEGVVTGKTYVTRSGAQKAAGAVGGRVEREGNRFVVRVDDDGQQRSAMESRGATQASSNGYAREIQHMADEVMRKLPGASHLQVHVVDRASQVPGSYEPSPNAEGVYIPKKGGGTIYLVTHNIASLDRAGQVLAHEVVGHYGMEALLGDRFADVLADVKRLTALPEGTHLGVQRPGDKHYATWDAVKMDYPDYSPENQAREVLARMVETGMRPHFIQRVMGYIRKALRAMGLGGEYSLAEIRNMVVDAAKRLRTSTPEESRAGVLSAAESLRRAESRRGNATVDMPDVLIGQKMGAAGAHADYNAAKAGDTHAAIRLVKDLVTPDVAERVRQEIGDQDVTLVPVVAVESSGHNKIPMAVAQRLGHDLGLKVDEGGIYQAVRAKRSALGGLDRLFRYPEFAGEVEPGRKYYLVDDTLTQGGTFAALANYIRSRGGEVVGEFALTGKQYSRTLRLSPDTLAQVRERYGDLENSFREATGRGFDGLTESEARYLVKHDSPDTIRDRILAEGHARVGERNAKGLPPEVTPESDRQAPPSEGLSSGEPPDILESRAAAGTLPNEGEPKEPRYRGNVERPGEKLSKIERNLRQRTMAKIGAFSEIEPIQDRVRKLTENWQAKAIQGVFDQFAPLKTLSTKAYMQARLSKGTDGAVEALFKAGSLKLTDGALDIRDANGGLLKTLSELGGEHDHWLAWIAGNRAKRLAAEGREHLFTPKDIDLLTNLDKGRMPDGRNRAEVYQKALKEFNALQKSVMDVAQEAGLIDGESRHLWENDFYVPFYRVMEEDQSGLLGPGQIGGLVGQYAFKKLKGGQERLGDLLGNTLSNWSHLVSASMKNLAANEAMKSAVDMGVAEKVPSSTKGSVRIMVKGHEQHYLVHDQLVLDALQSLHFTGFSGPIMKAMSKFKHMLTTGVTISPTFRLRNLARDTISAIAANDLSYNPMRNLVDGWQSTNKESDTYKRLLAGGGAIRFGALNDGSQATHAKRLIEAGVDEGQILDSQAKVKKAFAKTWEWYLETGDRAETVNRAAIYDQAIKAGKSHLEASYAARDLQDFTAGGKFASVRLLTQIVPFLNARLQGMYKLGRAATDDPRRFMAVTGAVGLASAGLFLLNRDDPDYKQLPDWVRNNYWVVRLPGSDKFSYIPKPFEIGALGSVVERLTELAVSGKDYQAKDFANTLLSLTMDQLSMNPIPQAIRPAMGAAFNYDDFRERDIDSDAQMHLPAGDRYTARTSAGAVLAGKALHISPQRLEYLLKGYFGWLGIQALNVADLAARPFTDMPANPSRDMSRIDNWFMVGDFVKEAGPGSSKYTQRFYNAQREIGQVYAAYSEARKVGDIERAQALAGDDLIKLRPLYQAANRQMQRINSRLKEIDNDPNMDNRDKEELRDALYLRRNRLAALVDERARAQQ
jgi:adenine/guanine phosphoribosyltransferase-like PRPP-binding protein